MQNPNHHCNPEHHRITRPVLQLPPPTPSGAPLCDIPDDILNAKFPGQHYTQRGLHLLWHSITHVVQLEKQVRCDDEWYQCILGECHRGELSENNHAFLHYNPTHVPGSWSFTKGTSECGKCDHLVGSSREYIWNHDCTQCRAERIRRARVMGSIPNDTRIQEPRFKQAITVVANNDLKFDICKRKAAEFARDTGQPVLWCPASDVAMSEAVKTNPNLQQEKRSWLTYHDKKCAHLYGMLPLVKGMRVSLTTHIDRSDKALLRGKSGTLVGWKLDRRERRPPTGRDSHLKYRPEAIFVKFDNAEWKLTCMQGCLSEEECKCHGIYAIKPRIGYWYLDSGRKNHASLKVKRYQLPIAPDFARTAYSMQGFTLDQAVVDLRFDSNTDPTTGKLHIAAI